MEIDKYFQSINSNYKLEWLENNDKLFSILNQDHDIYLDDLYVRQLNMEIINRAANIIQRQFRSYVDRLIFKKIKNVLIDYRFENPASFLRKRNLKEACLFDKIGCHYLVFRLSGQVFPPTIVYKIYSNVPLTKVNKFKTDVIPITTKHTNSKMKSNDKWKVIYKYKKNPNSKQLKNQKKWKMTQINKEKHTRNKQKLTWIFSKYK